MKNKSFIKTYGLLIGLIVVCIAGLAVLGLSLFSSKSVTMKDLVSLDKEEVVKWVSDNNLINNVEYKYEISLDVEKDKVISQNIDAGSSINEKVIIVISKGSIADVDNTIYKDKDSFEAFIKDYKDVTVTYEEKESDLEKGKIIEFSKQTIDLKKDEVNLIVSSGSNTEEKKEEEIKDGDKVLIPDNMLGMEENKFIKTLNDLGFKNLKKDSQKYYSFKSKKDTIFSYDDGLFLTSRTINYAISLGDYVSAFNKSDYEGKSLDDANSIVEKYNKLNAHVVLKTNSTQTEDSNKVGTLTSCSAKQDGSNSLVTCTLYTKKDKTVFISDDYLGKSESVFLDYLKGLKFTNFSKDSSRYSSYPKDTLCKYDSGNKLITDKIHYTLSLGSYVFNASDYDGNSVDGANALVKKENDKGANIKFTYSKVPNDSVAKNTLYGCIFDKNTITCKLANNKDKYTLPSKSILLQNYNGGSVDETKNNFAKLKSNFPNLHFTTTTSDKGVGVVVDVKVNGNSSFAGGEYDYDIDIEVIICSKQEE